MAARSIASAHRTRDRQSLLAAIFWHRVRQDHRRFWRPGRKSLASGIARLAGDGVRPHTLGREAAPKADRDVCNVSTILETDTAFASKGSRKPIARARAAFPARRRSGAGHRAGDQWFARGKTGRA